MEPLLPAGPLQTLDAHQSSHLILPQSLRRYLNLLQPPRQSTMDWHCKRQKCVFSQFGRLEVHDRGAVGVSFLWALSASWQTVSFSCVLAQPSLCVCVLISSSSFFFKITFCCQLWDIYKIVMTFAIHQYESAVGPPSCGPPALRLCPSHPSRLSQSTSFGFPEWYSILPLAIDFT